MPGNSYTQIKIMNQLSAREQKLISLNVTGGYQTAAVKAIWDNTQTLECEHCGQPIHTCIAFCIVRLLNT